MARITALITTYNHERFVAEAIESVLSQTFGDHDIVIADDASTDRTVAAARATVGGHGTVVAGEHVGYSANWARGLAKCRSEFIAFLAGDDIWLSDHLAIAVAALDSHPLAAFSYSFNEHVDERLERVAGGAPARAAQRAPSGRIDPSWLLIPNVIETHSVVVRREQVDAVGGVDTSLLFADVDLFVRLAAERPIVHTGEVTARYRMHPAGMSRDAQRMLEGWLALYERHLRGAGRLTRRRLAASRYLEAAYQQARRRPGEESSAQARRNLARAVSAWPPVALDRRYGGAVREILAGALR